MATSRICSIPECGKPHYARGWCAAHYARWRHHGDPLGGRTPWGEPLRYLNEVVLTYDGDECLTWPYSTTDAGYAVMRTDGPRRLVSRIVCEIANGPPPTPAHEAAHSCGKGHEGCVTKRHLSWKTSAGNHADKMIHGTHDRGERSANAKLTEADVLAIRSLRGTISQRAIACRFGVSRQNVGEILSGKRWAWLI